MVPRVLLAICHRRALAGVAAVGDARTTRGHPSRVVTFGEDVIGWGGFAASEAPC
jgi:hypothetical protein